MGPVIWPADNLRRHCAVENLQRSFLPILTAEEATVLSSTPLPIRRSGWRRSLQLQSTPAASRFRKLKTSFAGVLGVTDVTTLVIYVSREPTNYVSSLSKLYSPQCGSFSMQRALQPINTSCIHSAAVQIQALPQDDQHRHERRRSKYCPDK